MKNSKKTEYIKEDLTEFRKKIDVIDDKLVELLKARMDVVKEVGEYKRKHFGDKSFIRPAREVNMIKSITAKLKDVMPESAAAYIWRKIISSSNASEENLKIAIHNPSHDTEYNYLAREYYGDFIKTEDYKSATNIFKDMESGSASIGIFRLPDAHDTSKQENWWINLANNKHNFRIFAIMPFVTCGKCDSPRLVAVAKIDTEKSGADTSLISMETSNEVSNVDIASTLKALKIKGNIICTAKSLQISDVTFHMISLEGYVEDENDNKITPLKNSDIKPYIKILGTYGNPIKCS